MTIQDNREYFLSQSATVLAIVVASILVISKGIAWRYSGSLSVQASFIDSTLDALVSLINFFAIRHAIRPADSCHRFGHEKVEALTSLAQSILITLSILWFVKEIIEKIDNPHHVTVGSLVLWVMIGSTLLTIALVIWQLYVIKNTKSLAVEADSLHYKTDIITNIGVLITVFVSSYYQLPIIDQIVGITIVSYILYSSYKIAAKACDVLMDRELSNDIRNQIIETVTKHKDVLGIHNLRTRSSGKREFIQLNLVLDSNITLKKAHTIANEVEKMILNIFPKADVLIHQAPLV